jgi:chemotaxis signal transduction protein
VLDILSFAPAQVQPVPQIARSSRVGFLSGLVSVEGAMIALIDHRHLLGEPGQGADAAIPAATPPAAA